jgi:hypothetical protein
MPLSCEAEIMLAAQMGMRWGKNKSSKSTKKLASQCGKKQMLGCHGRDSSWAQNNHAAQIYHTWLALLVCGNKQSLALLVNESVSKPEDNPPNTPTSSPRLLAPQLASALADFEKEGGAFKMISWETHA